MLKNIRTLALLSFFFAATVPQVAQALCGGQGSFLTQKVKSQGAIIGQNWGVDFQAVNNAPFFVVLSFAPAQFIFPGIGEVCVDPNQMLVAGQGITSATGQGSVALPIPNDPTLLNITLFAQVLVFDASAPNGFSISQRIISPLSSLSSPLSHPTLVGARDLTLTQNNLAYFNPASSTVFDVNAALGVSSKYSRPGGLGMAAANFASGFNAFFIGSSNSNLYWDYDYGDTANTLSSICDPFDFGSASGSFTNSIVKVAFNHANRRVLLSDLISGQILKFTIDLTPDCSSGASELSALVYPSTVTALTGINTPRLKKMAGTYLTNDFFFWDETSDFILRGDTNSQNFAAVVLSRNDILAFTGANDVIVKTLSTDSLGNLFFYDSVSQQMIQRNAQGELATLFSYAQLQHAVSPGNPLVLEESQFDPRTTGGGLTILENLSGKIVDVRF